MPDSSPTSCSLDDQMSSVNTHAVQNLCQKYKSTIANAGSTIKVSPRVMHIGLDSYAISSAGQLACLVPLLVSFSFIVATNNAVMVLL
jgi:hypothetical protein